MIRTVVCKKEGCSGNVFIVGTADGKFKSICNECGNVDKFDFNGGGYEVASVCSVCNNSTFKVFRDPDSSSVFCKCTKCGNPPEKIFVDLDGVQLSYQEKILNEIKELMGSVEQRLCNLEIKMDDMERGQGILEQSLAYINKYIVEDR